MRIKFIILIILFTFSIPINNYKRIVAVSPRSLLHHEYKKCKDSLIIETRLYLDYHAKGHEINPEKYIDISLTYDVDFLLMLAQGLAESHFGTQGIAKRTNNIYNVGNTDDGSTKGYRDVHKGIVSYAKLMQERYLKNKSKHELLNNFVCNKGYRYASALNYEMRLKGIIKNISDKTKINNHYYKLKQIEKCLTEKTMHTQLLDSMNLQMK